MKNFSEFYHDLNGEFRENFPLANLTWFKVGGPAQMLFIPENKDDLVQFIKNTLILVCNVSELILKVPKF